MISVISFLSILGTLGAREKGRAEYQSVIINRLLEHYHGTFSGQIITIAEEDG
jgi:hypothetical protein